MDEAKRAQIKKDLDEQQKQVEKNLSFFRGPPPSPKEDQPWRVAGPTGAGLRGIGDTRDK